MNRLEVFEVEIDADITHWFAGHDAWEVLKLYLTMGEDWSESGLKSGIDDFSVSKVPEHKAKGLMIVVEDTGLPRSAWDLAVECSEPCLIGSTEW